MGMRHKHSHPKRSAKIAPRKSSRCHRRKNRKPNGSGKPQPARFDRSKRKLLRILFEGRLPAKLLNGIFRRHHSGRGAPARLTFAQLLLGLVYHVLMGHGSLSEHMEELFGISISGSALTQRQQGLSGQIFQEILDVGLQPMADPKRHPSAFYKGLRLVGVDGTCFSLTNTPKILRAFGKAATRRFRAAFAMVPVAVLVELGTHKPIGARVGEKQESEFALAWQLLEKLPPWSLLLGDRLYGKPVFVGELLRRCLELKGQFLVRVGKNLTRRVRQVLRDGSALVELQTRDSEGKKVRFFVREIRGWVHPRSGKRVAVRLWTSLLDARKYPAEELMGLYAQRWEVELMVKEVKWDLRGSDRLSSYTPETAMQEIAAVLLAVGMVAQVRGLASEQAEITVVRVSFRHALRLLRNLWSFLEVGEGILSARQVGKLIERTIEKIAQHVSPPRRRRSCPRAVRQPVGSWPRLLRRTEAHGPIHYEIKPLTK